MKTTWVNHGNRWRGEPEFLKMNPVMSGTGGS